MNNRERIIIEYGQYLSEKSKNKIICSSDSSSEARKDTNKNLYWYINKDGIRLTKIPNNINNVPAYIAESNNFNFSGIKAFNNRIYEVKWDIDFDITLKQLCDYFKGENWEAKKYNVLSHNCQHFAVEVIKILRAKRKYKRDKINERIMLPN